jgi:hypothetical protein
MQNAKEFAYQFTNETEESREAAKLVAWIGRERTTQLRLIERHHRMSEDAYKQQMQYSDDREDVYRLALNALGASIPKSTPVGLVMYFAHSKHGKKPKLINGGKTLEVLGASSEAIAIRNEDGWTAWIPLGRDCYEYFFCDESEFREQARLYRERAAVIRAYIRAAKQPTPAWWLDQIKANRYKPITMKAHNANLAPAIEQALSEMPDVRGIETSITVDGTTYTFTRDQGANLLKEITPKKARDKKPRELLCA